MVDPSAIVTLVLFMSGATAFQAWRRKQVRFRLEVWQSMAKQLGITHVEAEGRYYATVRGRVEGMRITVAEAKEKQPVILVTIEAPGVLPERLELREESMVTALQKIQQGSDLEVGDKNFDDQVLVRGHRALSLALLDADNRRRILALVKNGGQVQGGCLSRRCPGGFETFSFSEIVGELIETAQGLVKPGHPARWLALNALEDPLPTVRRRNLEVLIERFGNRAETTAVLRQALEDPSAFVRIKAATTLDGDEGSEVLEALAKDPKSNQSIAAEALLGLGPSFGSEQAIALLSDATSRQRRPVALAAIAVLGRIGGDAAIAKLGTLVSRVDSELASAAVAALGRCGGAESVEMLLATLDGGNAEVQLAALEAIGRLATIAAVPRLRAFVEAQRFRSKLSLAAVAAIAAIQERATGAAPGQLALAVAEVGELALVEEGQGRLSLAEDEK